MKVTYVKRAPAGSGLPRIPLDSIVLDRSSAVPLYRQLYEGIRTLIIDCRLPLHSRLPSTRELAELLEVSRNTAVAAYQQLEVEGCVETRRNSQTFIIAAPVYGSLAKTTLIDDPTDVLSARGRLMTTPSLNSDYFELAHRRSLQPGNLAINYFPFSTWRRIFNNRLQAGGDDVFGYHDIAGFPPLRTAIARYLATSRGVNCEPDQVVITTGAQSAFDLLSRILTDPGDLVWMEEPGYPAAQANFLAAGAKLAPLWVDASGWDLVQVPDDPIRVIYVTPSCHYPLGTTMRLEQRLRLIEIAKKKNAWIIEDDFDGEYRFAGAAIPALHGVSPNSRTIYVGTFSKTIFPSLRIGFMVMPKHITGNFALSSFLTGQYASSLMQAALADFISDGHFTTHLGRMRRLYRKRRDQFMSLCDSYLGRWLEPARNDAGIQSLWYCKTGINDHDILDLARRRDIVAMPLSVHYWHGNARSGLIFGYTALETSLIERELASLRSIFQQLERG